MSPKAKGDLSKAPGDLSELLPLEHRERAARLAREAPSPAVSGNVLFGTAGWTDPSLAQSGFYPSSVKTSEARLRHYATEFSFVEVDSTYYAIPAESVVQRWAEWTPPEFRFHVKAHPVFTGHVFEVSRLPSEVRAAFEAEKLGPRVTSAVLPEELRALVERAFLASMEPLLRAGKLASFLVQYPPWFEATRGAARQIEVLRERIGEHPVDVEFRHGSWTTPERIERVAALLASQRFGQVVVDEPVAATGVSWVGVVTRPELVVVRLHGRNVSGWLKKNATLTEKYLYLYSEEELLGLVEPLGRLASEAREVHVVFNNCVSNFAVLSARGLAALLERARASRGEGARA